MISTEGISAGTEAGHFLGRLQDVGARPGPPSITIHCLGEFAVTINGIAIQRWRAGKARALFQYLLLKRSRVVPRDTLVEVLWPGSASGSVSLKVAVHALRQILTTAQRQGPAATEPGSSLVLVSQGFGYGLKTQNVWIDFEEFERAIEGARQLELVGCDDEALELYRKAVELYRGEFVAGEPDWAEERREALKDYALMALHRLAEAALRLDDVVSVIRWCQRALEIEPCSEETYRLLMFCHARLGQPSRVKAWYEACVRNLRERLAVGPEPATIQLLERTLSGELAPRPRRLFHSSRMATRGR